MSQEGQMWVGPDKTSGSQSGPGATHSRLLAWLGETVLLEGSQATHLINSELNEVL